MGLSYYQIKKRIEELGKELEANELARKIQLQLSEPGASVSFKDAYEMAYNEILRNQYI
tara:strand:- start:1305 stop:1481 length:177 start_codon:yes stop_codon:yes gene_type:complete